MKSKEELLALGRQSIQVRLPANLVLAIESANWSGDPTDTRPGGWYRPYDFANALRQVLPKEVLDRAKVILDRQVTARRRTVTRGSSRDSRRGP